MNHNSIEDLLTLWKKGIYIVPICTSSLEILNIKDLLCAKEIYDIYLTFYF